jgi:hypothetical protein
MLSLRTLSLLLVPALGSAASYQLCFLENGPNAGKIEKERAQQLQASHMQHINAMWQSGSLESAGPVSGLPGSRGIFLFDSSMEESMRLGAGDPKVAAGELKLTCHGWTGPSGVGNAYRQAYGKPGFQDKMARRVAVLFLKPVSAASLPNVIVSGPLTRSAYAFFAVLDTDDLAKVQAAFPEARAFQWFHDTQVWNGVN